MNTHKSSHLTIAVDFDLVVCLGSRSVLHLFVSLLSYLSYLLTQFQGDPDLDIKDEPEAWSVTVDKKVRINKCVCSFSCCCSSLSVPSTLFKPLTGNSKRNEI